MEKEINIDDISPIKGVYSEFILTKSNDLISILDVEGINLDLLEEYEQANVFESYEAFLVSLTNTRDDLETISMTVPVDMKRYNMYWKKRFLEVEKAEMNEEIKNNLLQLIASNCVEFEKIATQNEITTKKHLLVVKEKVNGNSRKELLKTEEKLNYKVSNIQMVFREMFDNHDIACEVLETDELLKTLQKFLDNKNSVFI